ncbi:MAG TPA: hypothetical protein VHE61_07710 [Opitutaceae bacterium]|nr:hypothetical protein [Opitutaceae bacterium]
MNSAFFYTLTVTGFTVAFLHAAIPTHWLPFVVVGRARNWSPRQILTAVALAGGGHILVTTALGVGLAWFGFELNDRVGGALHWIVAAVLIGLGAWLALRAPHGHACNHCRGEPEKRVSLGSDRAVLVSMFLTLTLSPCELFLPVYLTAVPFGWPGIAWLSAVLAIATLGAMLSFTWATLRGVERLPWIANPNPRLLGAVLCALGFMVVWLER